MPEGFPASQGLYTGRHEHDACGVAFVATMTGVASYDIVSKALIALRNLEHRGAAGSDPDSGDGAGILTQVPDAFLRAVVDFELPAAGEYAVGAGFLPQDGAERADAEQRDQRDRSDEGLAVLGWRDVPDHAVAAGCRVRAPPCRSCARSSSRPTTRRPRRLRASDGLGLERAAFVLRKRAEREVGIYFPSLSSRTLVYKGMLTTGQLEPFYPDLSDRRYASAVALVHSRFSTNTFPSWPLAHPYRYVAHNGEINTVMGNRNWMRARESQLVSDLIPGDLERLFPICTPGRERLGELRRGPRTAAPRRAVAAARGADDDPGGVGEQPDDGPGPAGVLRVPLHADGALGRPGLDHLHRRHVRRGGARPQRPAALPVLGDRRRPGRHGQRGRRARHRAVEGGRARAACSPAACSSSTWRSTASSRTRRSSPGSPPSTPTTSGCTPA